MHVEYKNAGRQLVFLTLSGVDLFIGIVKVNYPDLGISNMLAPATGLQISIKGCIPFGL